MSREFVVLIAITATMLLGQEAGIGNGLIENYPDFGLENIRSVIICIIMLLVAHSIASATVTVVWNTLSPINRATVWEKFAVDWLSLGVGAWAIVLNFGHLPIAEATLVAVWVLIAGAPVLFIDYALFLRQNDRVEPEYLDRRQLLAPMFREARASFASAFIFLAVHILPLSLIILFFGAATSPAELLNASMRSIPFLLLASIAWPHYLVPIGLWVFRLVRFKRPTAYGQHVWAFATPLCIFLLATLAVGMLADLRISVAFIFAVLALVGSCLAGIVYVRLRYDFATRDFDLDSTFA